MTFINEWWLIASREYKVRIRKRSFLFFTLLGPIVFLASMIVPMFLTMDTTEKTEVLIQSKRAIQLDLPTNDFKWKFVDSNQVVDALKKSNANVLVAIDSEQKKIAITDFHGLTLTQRVRLEKFANQLYKEDVLLRTGVHGFKPELTFHSLAPESKSMDLAYIVALASAVLIYFFIVFYGVQVMRGVIEEKSSRVVEIVLSSVRPFAFMLGKILGIAGVCMTQFLFWAMAYLGIASLIKAKYGAAMNQFNGKDMDQLLAQSSNVEQVLEWNTIINNYEQLPLMKLAIGFVGFFLLGYLLYAAIFATVASMTDNETETQQFSFPLTMPLFLMFLFAGPLMKDPNGFWLIFLSYFPVTSPIAMLLRISFGVAIWEVVTSLLVLFSSFVGVTYFSAKVFKRNILQYGSTFSLTSLFKK
jgi:ABC-2 type transport system permease protein